MPRSTATNTKPTNQSTIQAARPKPTAIAGSVLERLGNWDALQHDRGLKINIYGRSGTGKSTWCATAPKPILYAICSGGKKPGEMLSIDTPDNREGIDPIVLDKSADLAALIQHQDETETYKTFVLDHASGFQDLVMREICGFQDIPQQLGFGATKSAISPQVTQQQWGQIAAQCKETFRKLLSLDCHIIIVAQEREYKPESADDLILPSVCAAITPSLAGWLNAAVDYILNTYIRPKYEEREVVIQGSKQIQKTFIKGKVDYCLRTGPHSTYTTKFRLPRTNVELPECIVDPSFDKVLDLINKARSAANESSA